MIKRFLQIHLLKYTQSQLHNLEQEAKGIGLNINSGKTWILIKMRPCPHKIVIL